MIANRSRIFASEAHASSSEILLSVGLVLADDPDFVPAPTLINPTK